MAGGRPVDPAMLFELDSRPALIASAALLGASFAVALAVTPVMPPAAAVDVPRIAVPIAVPMTPPSSNGLVVPPPDFADARPWPRGMVITPPATGDRMAIVSPPGYVVLSGLIAPLARALRRLL